MSKTDDPQPVDLTKLMERLNSELMPYQLRFRDGHMLSTAERDEIVLALRVLRVLRALLDHGSAWVHSDGSILISSDNLTLDFSDVPLDEAERILGIEVTP